MGGSIICHSGQKDKDIFLFQSELDKLFSDEESEYFDLTGFCFPDGDYKLPMNFRKDVYFTFSRFYGNADFDFTVFHGKVEFAVSLFFDGASFIETVFERESIFANARFFKNVQFSRSLFEENADFSFVTFQSPAYFSSVGFNGSADFHHARAIQGALVSFDGEKGPRISFTSGADFTSFDVQADAKIRFRRISFQKCRLLELDATRAEITDVVWPNTPKLFRSSRRKAVQDELEPNSDWLEWHNLCHKGSEIEPSKYQYTLIAELYRRLQINYINNYRYSEAGDFHIGEQEMMRKAKGKIRQYLSTNFLYKIISYYGESFTLPLFWLAFVLLLFPAVLLYDGINLNPTLQDPAVAETVNYEWSWSPGNFLPAKSDYWEAFVANFSLIAYSRSDIGKYLPEPHTRFIVTIESLIVIALLAFFLLALRRQYKRKTF